MKKHKRVPLWMLKDRLIADFEEWCKERSVTGSDPRDMIEFLLQKRFLQGKKWLEYIDGIDYTLREMLDGRHQHLLLMEGFIVQDCMIGPAKEEKDS